MSCRDELTGAWVSGVTSTCAVAAYFWPPNDAYAAPPMAPSTVSTTNKCPSATDDQPVVAEVERTRLAAEVIVATGCRAVIDELSFVKLWAEAAVLISGLGIEIRVVCKSAECGEG